MDLREKRSVMERVQAFREKIAYFREIYREKSHENLRIPHNSRIPALSS